MAQDKKGFLLYADQIHTIELLDDKKAGQLLKHIFKYVNDQDPQTTDPIIKLAFEPIKQALKRDLKKYENLKKRNKENADKRWNKGKKGTKKSDRIRPHTKNADRDSDSDRDRGSDKEREIKDTYTRFDHLTISKTECNKLWEQGYSKEQIDHILESIQNFKGNKKYKSLYLTAKNWQKREYPETTKTKTTKQDDKQRKQRDAAGFH